MSVATVVEPLGAILLLSVCVSGSRQMDVTDRLHGGSGADGSVGGDDGADVLCSSVAAVCVGGSRLTQVTDPLHGGDGADQSVGGDGGGDAPGTVAVAAAACGGKADTAAAAAAAAACGSKADGWT